jgi:UDP-N-acetylbacillosamine N-acetyltransferase
VVNGSGPRIVIWGASGHALVVCDILRELGGYTIVGFLDDIDPRPRWLPRHRGQVLGGAEVLDELRRAGVTELIVAVGDCETRLRLAEIAHAKGFRLATAVHPRATVASDVRIGDGSTICAGAVVNPGCIIGRNAIVNTGATVDHECVLEDGVHVSPGAHLGGGVVVRRAAWVGIGATVNARATVGERSILGAGAVLLSDLPDSVVAYGVPATVRQVRKANV